MVEKPEKPKTHESLVPPLVGLSVFGMGAGGTWAITTGQLVIPGIILMIAGPALLFGTAFWQRREKIKGYNEKLKAWDAQEAEQARKRLVRCSSPGCREMIKTVMAEDGLSVSDAALCMAHRLAVTAPVVESAPDQ